MAGITGDSSRFETLAVLPRRACFGLVPNRRNGNGRALTVSHCEGRLGWRPRKQTNTSVGGYGFLSTPDIKAKDIECEDVNHITADRYFESPEIIVGAGDVLLAEDGSTLGIVNVVHELPSLRP